MHKFSLEMHVWMNAHKPTWNQCKTIELLRRKRSSLYLKGRQASSKALAFMELMCRRRGGNGEIGCLIANRKRRRDRIKLSRLLNPFQIQYWRNSRRCRFRGSLWLRQRVSLTNRDRSKSQLFTMKKCTQKWPKSSLKRLLLSLGRKEGRNWRKQWRRC